MLIDGILQHVTGFLNILDKARFLLYIEKKTVGFVSHTDFIFIQKRFYTKLLDNNSVCVHIYRKFLPQLFVTYFLHNYREQRYFFNYDTNFTILFTNAVCFNLHEIVKTFLYVHNHSTYYSIPHHAIVNSYFYSLKHNHQELMQMLRQYGYMYLK